MPGYFPHPVPGELLEGAVETYGRMLGLAPGRRLSKDAYGLVGEKVFSRDRPVPFDLFASRLPPGHTLTGDVIYDLHTSLPYDVAFASARQAAASRRWAVHGGCRRPPTLGVFAHSAGPSTVRRSCPACLSEDTSAGRAPRVWRWHCLPGVSVCAVHALPLTPLQVWPGTPLGSPGGAGARLRLARWSAWAVGREPSGFDLEALQRSLHGLLVDFRWKKAPSLLRTGDVADAMLAHPGSRLMLSSPGSTPSADQLVVALRSLLGAPRRAKHPIIVFALLEMLGAGPDCIVGGAGPRRHAKEAQTDAMPAPCASPFCGRSTPTRDVPRGRYTCDACGFRYRWDPDARVRFSVLATGDLWDRRLVQSLAVPGASLRSVARSAGVAPMTLMRHARRLGVGRDGWTCHPKTRPLSRERASRLGDLHRRAWTDFRKCFPEVRTDAFPAPVRNAYRWLRRHDRAWLADNRPMASAKPCRVDWAARDAAWADEVGRMAVAASPGARLLVGEAIDAVGGRWVARANRHRLPAMWAILDGPAFRDRAEGAAG